MDIVVRGCSMLCYVDWALKPTFLCNRVQRFDVLLRPTMDWGPSPESGRLQDYQKAEQQMADMPPIARWQPPTPSRQPCSTKYDRVHTVDLHTVDLHNDDVNTKILHNADADTKI